MDGTQIGINSAAEERYSNQLDSTRHTSLKLKIRNGIYISAVSCPQLVLFWSAAVCVVCLLCILTQLSRLSLLLATEDCLDLARPRLARLPVSRPVSRLRLPSNSSLSSLNWSASAQNAFRAHTRVSGSWSARPARSASWTSVVHFCNNSVALGLQIGSFNYIIAH